MLAQHDGGIGVLGGVWVHSLVDVVGVAFQAGGRELEVLVGPAEVLSTRAARPACLAVNQHDINVARRAGQHDLASRDGSQPLSSRGKRGALQAPLTDRRARLSGRLDVHDASVVDDHAVVPSCRRAGYPLQLDVVSHALGLSLQRIAISAAGVMLDHDHVSWRHRRDELTRTDPAHLAGDFFQLLAMPGQPPAAIASPSLALPARNRFSARP